VPVSDRSKVAVVIYAKDIVAVSEFYAAVLAAPDTRREEDHVVLETPECQLVVLAIPAPIAADIVITNPPSRRSETPLKLAFPVDSIAASRSTAAQHGGQIDPPDHEWQFGDDRVCDGHDPEGNVLQLRERLP
jgi:predicted enzyme related to lactoylglutathione lyase